jgi:hypothetical protein
LPPGFFTPSWRGAKRGLDSNETQKQIDAAKEDLGAIVQAELGYIEKPGNSQRWMTWFQVVTLDRRWRGVTARFAAFVWKEKV